MDRPKRFSSFKSCRPLLTLCLLYSVSWVNLAFIAPMFASVSRTLAVLVAVAPLSVLESDTNLHIFF